jgi:inner membrane protein
VFALILALIFHRLLKKGDANNTWTFAKTWAVGLLALYIHLFLDCMTTFGTQIFLPVSNYRVALPAIYIIDLAMTLPLFSSWICILRRGGSKAPAARRTPIARGSLAWLFAYPLFALCLNYTAAHALEKRYATAGNERV